MDNPTRRDVPYSTATAGAEPLTIAEQRAVMAKVTARLIPLLFFCYIIAYIDRINVGFAKLHLREVLGVDPAVFSSVYGLGAGLFFIGYFLFEVPSNLILQRVGARIWIARIMIVWGLVSMAFMFMKGVTMFYVMRFLLGAAEAGFFPGVILYLTYWYPARERARTIALFALGGVSAGVIGSPISGALLGLNGVGGLAGWQWLFLLEAIPAVLMGLVVLFILPNGPQHARWLSDREKGWIQSRLSGEASCTDSSQRHSLKDAFTSGRVWLLCLLYFLLNVGGYGFEMWLPTIVKGFSGRSDAVVGLLNMIPYFVAGVAMLLVGQHSDRTGERRGHLALAATSAAIGFVLAAYFKSPYLAMAGLTLAFAGIKSTLGPFWALSTAFLSGTAAAGGIALINSVGNLGGFVGPYLVGIFKDRTGSDVAALLLLGGALFSMGLFALALPAPARVSPEKS
jgi:ACS family tartrate transporter-like MFS transporter